MNNSSLLYVFFKEEVGQEENKTILYLHKKEGGNLLNVDGDPVDEGDNTFEEVMYLYVFN